MKLSLLPLLAFSLVACASSTLPSEESATTEGNLSDAKVKLPENDPCRPVLAPLALGLADGAVGLDFAHAITVSLVSTTEVRDYVVSVARDGAPVRFSVTLDNDSHSKCFFESVKTDMQAPLANDARSRATATELHPTTPRVTLSPTNDDCATSVKLLSQAVALSAVGPSSNAAVTTTLASETEDRDYDVHVSDYDFHINVSNDSAFKCWMNEITRK